MGSGSVHLILIIYLTLLNNLSHLWLCDLSIAVRVNKLKHGIKCLSIYISTHTLEERIQEKNSLILFEDVILVGIKFIEVFIYLSVDSLFVKVLHL